MVLFAGDRWSYLYIISVLAKAFISLMAVLLFRPRMLGAGEYQKLSTRIIGANFIAATQSFQWSSVFLCHIQAEPVWNDCSLRRRRLHCVLPPPIILNVDVILWAYWHSEGNQKKLFLSTNYLASTILRILPMNLSVYYVLELCNKERSQRLLVYVYF